MIRSAQISGIATAFPATVLGNEELARLYPEWPAEKIRTKLGISERRVAGATETAGDIACAAAERLLEREATDRSTIDFLLFCTQSPDYFLPTTACLLQARLGLRTSCGALDFNLGCSGFVYGLGLAKALIETRQASSVLLLTADTYSKYIHPGDKSVRTVFGDAGSATLLTAVESTRPTGIRSLAYGTDGRGARALIVPTGGQRTPHIPDAPDITDSSGNVRNENSLYMDGAEVFAFTLREVPPIVARVLALEEVGMADVDRWVFHQANAHMLDHLRRKLAIPPDRFIIDMEDCGNTVSSTIPIALERAVKSGIVRPGMRIGLVGFGVGLSWAAAIVEWGRPD